MWPELLYGIGVVIVLLVIFVWLLRYMTGCRSGYSAKVTDYDRRIIQRLVVVSRSLGRTDPTRAELAGLIGVQSIHPEIYFRFKQLRAAGKLSEDRLVSDLETGGTWPSVLDD